MQVHRFTVATESTPQDTLAFLSRNGVNAATITPSWGSWVSEERGLEIEAGQVIETTSPAAYPAIAALLSEQNEDAAYFTVDGRNPSLLFPNGDREAL